MPVVINEFEMSSAPAAKAESGAGPSKAHESPATLAPDVLRQIEKALHAKSERMHRLTAY